MKRRDLLKGISACAMTGSILQLRAGSIFAAPVNKPGITVPASGVINKINVGNPITVSGNAGDTWVGAWSDDGNIYSPSNDTNGFGGVCQSNVAFNKVTGGDPLRLTGTTVNAMSEWEFFTGGNGMLSENWDHDANQEEPIIEDQGKLGSTGPTYIPEWHTYLMITWYFPAGGGKLPDASEETVWIFYQSSSPWGPWKKVSSFSFNPQASYNPNICSKFATHNGHRVFAIAAGDWRQKAVYKLSLIPIDLD